MELVSREEGRKWAQKSWVQELHPIIVTAFINVYFVLVIKYFILSSQ